jgi:hypothetical protein
MMTGTAIVAMIASLGWLFLNFRALQADGLSLQKKLAMAVAWAIIIAGLAVILSRFGM